MQFIVSARRSPHTQLGQPDLRHGRAGDHLRLGLACASLRTQFAWADDFDPTNHERRSVARTGESEVSTAFRLLELMLRETSSIVSNLETQSCLVEVPNHVDRSRRNVARH